MTRISAGVDVSKNRSTVCIMDQDGKVIMRPFLVWHSTEEVKLSSAARLFGFIIFFLFHVLHPPCTLSV